MSKKIRSFSDKKQPPIFPDLYFWATERIETIRIFLEMVEKQHKISSHNDVKRYDNLDEIWEDFWGKREALNLADQLSIVALYRIAEIGTQKILELANTYLGDQRKKHKLQAFRWAQLQELLSENFNFHLKNVKFFSSINELRCLNNDIKHSGMVGKDLAQFKGWQEGKDLFLYNLHKHFKRFAVQVPEYLEALSSGIKTNL